MATPQTWSHVTFTELMKHSPKEAFEYRFRTLGDPIPEKYLDKESLLTEEDKAHADSVAETVNSTAAQNPPDFVEAGNVENRPVDASSEDVTDAGSENVETPVKKASKNAKKA